MQVVLDAWLFSAFPSRASGSESHALQMFIDVSPPFEDLRQYSRASAGDKITPIRWLKHSKPCSSKCLSTFPPLRGPQGKTFESLRVRHSRTSGDSLREPQGKTFEGLWERKPYCQFIRWLRHSNQNHL
jgi:hypothetical protein